MNYKEEFENVIKIFTNGEPINEEIPINNTGVTILFPNNKPKAIKETHVPCNLLINKNKFNHSEPEKIIKTESVQKILNNIEEIILDYDFNKLDKPIHSPSYSTKTHYLYHMLIIRN